MSRNLGVLLIVAGLAVAGIGLLLSLGLLGWFSRLPGDLRIERESFGIYVPITTMVLVSAILSGVLYLVRRFLG